MFDHALVLGAGYTGMTVLTLAAGRGLRTTAVVRSAERARELSGHEVLVRPHFDASLQELVGQRTLVVVTFPPDGETDARVELQAPAISYVSSTGVYGGHAGVIDAHTAVPAPASATAQRLLDAEQIWLRRGATVLRSPAIYGADRGIHLRIVRGQHKLPGDGSRYTSRIHVEDLAALLLAAWKAPAQVLVVGDERPTTQREIAEWVSNRFGVPMPPSVPLSEVHETLRGDRRVDGSEALKRLGVTLRYPSFEHGLAAAR